MAYLFLIVFTLASGDRHTIIHEQSSERSCKVALAHLAKSPVVEGVSFDAYCFPVPTPGADT